MKKFISIIKYSIIALVTGGIVAALGYFSRGFSDWNIKNWFNKNEATEESSDNIQEEGMVAITESDSQLSVKAIAKGVDDENRDYTIFSYQLLDANGEITFRNLNNLSYRLSTLDQTTVYPYSSSNSFLDVDIDTTTHSVKVTKLQSFSFPIYLTLSGVVNNSTLSSEIVIYCPEELPYSTYVNDSNIGAMYFDSFNKNPFPVNSIKRIPNGDYWQNTLAYDDTNNCLRIEHASGTSENIVDGFMSSASYKDYYCSLDLEFDNDPTNANADFYIIFGICGISSNEFFSCDDAKMHGHPYLHVTNTGITWHGGDGGIVGSESMNTPLSSLGQSSLFTFTVGTGDTNQWVAVNYGNNPGVAYQMDGQCNGKFAIVFGLDSSVKANVNSISIDKTSGHYNPIAIELSLKNRTFTINKNNITNASIGGGGIFVASFNLINTHIYDMSLIMDSALAGYIDASSSEFPANGVFMLRWVYPNTDIPVGTYNCCLEVYDYGYTTYNTFSIVVTE